MGEDGRLEALADAREREEEGEGELAEGELSRFHLTQGRSRDAALVKVTRRGLGQSHECGLSLAKGAAAAI